MNDLVLYSEAKFSDEWGDLGLAVVSLSVSDINTINARRELLKGLPSIGGLPSEIRWFTPTLHICGPPDLDDFELDEKWRKAEKSIDGEPRNYDCEEIALSDSGVQWTSLLNGCRGVWLTSCLHWEEFDALTKDYLEAAKDAA